MQDEILMSSLKINKVDNAETFKQLKSSEYYNSEEVYVLEDYISSSDVASGISAHNNDEAAHGDIRALANEKLNDEQVQSKIDEALSGLDDFATVPVQDTAPESAEAYDLWIDTSVDGNSTVNIVTSVNGQKGDVVIEIPTTPEDIGAAKSPIKNIITLPSSDWLNNSQTIAVVGVLADEMAQLISVMPASISREIYDNTGVECIAQAEDSLTFTADKAPTIDLTVYVVIQEV